MQSNQSNQRECLYCVKENTDNHEIGCKYYKKPLKKKIPAVIATIILSPIAIIVGGSFGFIVCAIFAISKTYNKIFLF